MAHDNRSTLMMLDLTELCYPMDSVCDGDEDVPGGADEQNCTEWKCLDSYRKCDDNLECYPESKTCDSHTDCNDESDEKVLLTLKTKLSHKIL